MCDITEVQVIKDMSYFVTNMLHVFYLNVRFNYLQHSKGSTFLKNSFNIRLDHVIMHIFGQNSEKLMT